MILEFAIAAAMTLPKHYHLVTFDNTTSHRKSCVVGTVVYKRHQEDDDWHVTLIDGKQKKLVAEIIPELPFVPPDKNDKVLICGIASKDEHHGGTSCTLSSTGRRSMNRPNVSPGVVMAAVGAFLIITAILIDYGITAAIIGTGVSLLIGAVIYTIATIESY
jgi:hypothetical protein